SLFFQIGMSKLGTSWINEQPDDVCPGDHFVQQLQALRSYRYVPSCHARYVSAWSVQARDKPKLDWVKPNVEDDRDCGPRSLCCQCSWGAGRHGNYAHLLTN